MVFLSARRVVSHSDLVRMKSTKKLAFKESISAYLGNKAVNALFWEVISRSDFQITNEHSFDVHTLMTFR